MYKSEYFFIIIFFLFFSISNQTAVVVVRDMRKQMQRSKLELKRGETNILASSPKSQASGRVPPAISRATNSGTAYQGRVYFIPTRDNSAGIEADSVWVFTLAAAAAVCFNSF